MISSHQFLQLSDRYKAYLNSLKITDPVVQEHIDFKVQHTYRVISNIEIIARETGLSEADVQLAKTIALVHDIGRYEQFMIYHTFDDRESVNHAELGVRIIGDIDIFKDVVGEDDRKLIVQAVMNHNIPGLDPENDETVLLFSRLIRDADKVDILKILSMRDVVFKILETESREIAYEVPERFTDCFRHNRIIRSGAVSMNDYRLLRLSWIYDMNFPATFRLISKHNYASKIMSKIPASEKKEEIAGIILQYIETHCDETSHQSLMSNG